MKEQFIPGPIQEAWLQSLEQHPERQVKLKLGVQNPDGTYGLCCLGQGLLIICEYKDRTPDWRQGILYSYNDDSYIAEYDELGLRDSTGRLEDPVIVEDKAYGNLGYLNDSLWTWPEIAAYIRANPENVFTKSV